LPIKGGGLLRTVDDARAYVLALPSQAQPEWEQVCTLISKEADIVAISRQVLLALLLDDQLDLKVFARKVRGDDELNDAIPQASLTNSANFFRA
jgi:hypothetical protein